jgi:hypothetical protein
MLTRPVSKYMYTTSGSLRTTPFQPLAAGIRNPNTSSAAARGDSNDSVSQDITEQRHDSIRVMTFVRFQLEEACDRPHRPAAGGVTTVLPVGNMM